jgi:hypothetical protein
MPRQCRSGRLGAASPNVSSARFSQVLPVGSWPEFFALICKSVAVILPMPGSQPDNSLSQAIAFSSV